MNNRWLFISLVIFYFSGVRLCAQDSAVINYLVHSIAQQQTQQHRFFLKNIYPSYISSSNGFHNKKQDNNIFFTALIDHTLQSLKSQLSLQNAITANSIHRAASGVYPLFKNKKGRNTYNFWRTDTAYTFPYTSWIHTVKKNTALPDDLDDTVLSLMAQNTDSATAAEVHALMQQYTNRGNIKSISKNYRSYNAYSVWYGKNFPVVFDVCVLSNILSFVQTYNLQWTQADTASLLLVTHALQTGDYLHHPLSVSPYYGNSSIVLYHIARLMHIKKIPALEALKPQLIADAVQLFAATKNPLEKAILSTAIFKWGYNPPTFKLPAITGFTRMIEQNDLSFFIGNIPSYFANSIRNLFMRNGWGLFYHYCPAYNNVLVLEYLVWKQASLTL